MIPMTIADEIEQVVLTVDPNTSTEAEPTICRPVSKTEVVRLSGLD